LSSPDFLREKKKVPSDVLLLMERTHFVQTLRVLGSALPRSAGVHACTGDVLVLGVVAIVVLTILGLLVPFVPIPVRFVHSCDCCALRKTYAIDREGRHGRHWWTACMHGDPDLPGPVHQCVRTSPRELIPVTGFGRHGHGVIGL
jgi:hypothetical protein